jgi:hypothetical protein
MQDDNGQVNGDPNLQSSDATDTGTQDVDANNSGDTANQNGQQPDPRDAQIAEMKRQNRALNQRLIDARRGSKQQPNGGQQDPSAFETPEGQYGISIQLATANLSRKLESIYDLYPEIPASEVKRIRLNPWAFASLESMQSGDVETALTEIEQALLDRAEEVKGTQTVTADANNTQQTQQPATVNKNNTQEPVVDAEPGSDEDTNPWTMPLSSLEKAARKQLIQKSNTA